MFVYLQVEKAGLKREIKWKMIGGLDQNELVLLKFSKEETKEKLQWEHSKEFEYNGQMYDVVSKEIRGDTIYYRCWWDHEETALNKKLKKLVAGAFDQDEDQQQTHKRLNNFLQSFFISEAFQWRGKLVEISEVSLHSNLPRHWFCSRCLPPPTPPPQFG